LELENKKGDAERDAGVSRPPPRNELSNMRKQRPFIEIDSVLKINMNTDAYAYAIISAVFGLTVFQISTSSFHTRSSASFPSVDKTKRDGLNGDG